MSDSISPLGYDSSDDPHGKDIDNEKRNTQKNTWRRRSYNKDIAREDATFWWRSIEKLDNIDNIDIEAQKDPRLSDVLVKGEEGEPGSSSSSSSKIRRDSGYDCENAGIGPWRDFAEDKGPSKPDFVPEKGTDDDKDAEASSDKSKRKGAGKERAK